MLKHIVVTLVVAVVLLITVILPAEYSIDPTGIGGKLGLTELSNPAPQATEQSSHKRLVFIDTASGLEELPVNLQQNSDEPIPLPNPTVFQDHTAAPETRHFTITLQPNEQTEIKMLLKAGQVALFQWTSNIDELYVDFHGHIPDADAYWVRYKEEESNGSGQGSLVAPFDGEHGWYWLNISESVVTITLDLQGYFYGIKDYGISSSSPF